MIVEDGLPGVLDLTKECRLIYDGVLHGCGVQLLFEEQSACRHHHFNSGLLHHRLLKQIRSQAKIDGRIGTCEGLWAMEQPTSRTPTITAACVMIEVSSIDKKVISIKAHCVDQLIPTG